jgi:hypothetical protein
VTGQQLMTQQQLRKALTELPVGQAAGAPLPDCKTELKILDHSTSFVIIGQSHGAQRQQRQDANRNNRRHGRVVTRPIRHAPLIAGSRPMPIRRRASRALPSGNSRATALLMAGKARSLFRSCMVPGATASNRPITTQSD